jgi:endonuclease G
LSRKTQGYLVAVILVLVVVAVAWMALSHRTGTPEVARAPAASPALTASECNGAIFNGAPQVGDPAAAAGARRFCHSFYEVAYSTRLRDPLWSASHVTRAMAQAADGFGRTNVAFAAQDGLAPDEQGDTDDYRGSGYDRGHMTPANDAPDEASEKDTFVVTNIVPQTKVLNERLWQYLEASVHQIAERDGEVYVVTGPIFDDAPAQVNGRIAAPASTFKAIYVPSTGVAIAYVATNTDTPTCSVVSLAELKQQSGVDAFPALAAPVKAERPDFELPHGVHIVRGEPRAVPLPDCA